MTEQELRELFAEHGSVDAVDVIMDRETGRPRGFAFVEMDNADAAIEALNGREIGGRTMRVDEANERPRR
jgi:RNA recognition motif-containing protein